MISNPFQSDGHQNWLGRWAAIDAFIRDWFEVDYKRDPATDQIHTLEQSAGVTLPASAREWCSFAFASKQIERVFSFRDYLVVDRLKDHDAVSLLLQGEGDFYWAIETEFLKDPDPPVWAYSLDYDGPVERFLRRGLWAPTVSSFALDYLLAYMHSPGGGFSVRRGSANFRREALIADFGLPTIFGHLELFIGDGVFAVLSTFPANWNHGTIHVQVQRNTPFDSLPMSIQRLLPDAHIVEGPLAKYR